MPKVAKGKRKRAYSPKTRSGCLTCKLRRVKCDEARPVCQRCSSTKRICDGYEDAVQALTSSSPSSVELSVEISPDAESRRSFNFFVQHTRPQLTGFFASPFWERLVLQAAHHEPVIRHSLVAIGSIHEHKALGESRRKMFALEQYNAAIRKLLTPETSECKHSVDVCLIAAILFTCFENIQGHHDAAGAHIRSCSKLLQETFSGQKPGETRSDASEYQCDDHCYASIDVLGQVLAGLDSDTAQLWCDYKSRSSGSKHPYILGENDALHIHSLEQAREIFDYGRLLLMHDSQTLASSPDFEDGAQSRHAYIKSLAKTFSRALDDFVGAQGHAFTVAEQISVAVLQLHSLYGQVSSYMRHRAAQDGTGLQAVLPQMRTMVDFGRRIISHLSSDVTGSSHLPSFCLDLGYIIPLYTVASQAPDTDLRREAIALLRSMPRQEGLWNSVLVADAAQRILEIEQTRGVKLLGEAVSRSSSFKATQETFQLDNQGGSLLYNSQLCRGTGYGMVKEQLFYW